MANYKTPGVFVEEIPKFPPSVAQVETTIPAFIGYTQSADDIIPGDLGMKPRRIGSMVEFELFYGYGPSPNVAKVNVDDNNIFKSAEVTNSYYLYDSLRLFFSNGGGDCYIISIGSYSTTPDDIHFTNAIDALMKVDEPTILLFPDAVTLSDSDLSAVYQKALAHCADEARMDRVAVLDLKEKDPKGVLFRPSVGINFLSYGMAYTPWLKVSLPKNVKYTDVKGVIFRSGASVQLTGLTANAEVQTQVNNLQLAYNDLAKINTKIAAVAVPASSLRGQFDTLVAAYNTAKTNPNFQNIVKYLGDIGDMINDLVLVGSPDELTLPALKTDVTGGVTSTLSPFFANLVGLDKEADPTVNLVDGITGYASQVNAATIFTAASWAPGIAATPATNVIDGATDAERRDNAISDLQSSFDNINNGVLSLILQAAESYTKKLDEGLELAFPVYKNILKGVRDSTSTMPPSGAVVGVYAMVDRTRGVWKAPANVSLANVIAPAETFTKTELDALNVDVTAGKSINAIRTFFGKGTLIYGARTLAGNDNEWRYIPVRRLFVMVEESVKNATQQFVFEPNDANTWVKVQAMIENFLHNIWRQGALQGAKPDHAFYVAVGLGRTMNPIDILEGRMIVEIGMAAVRPAEFIILRFSHKMAES